MMHTDHKAIVRAIEEYCENSEVHANKDVAAKNMYIEFYGCETPFGSSLVQHILEETGCVPVKVTHSSNLYHVPEYEDNAGYRVWFGKVTEQTKRVEYLSIE